MQGVIRRGFSPRIMLGMAGAFVLAAFAFSGSAEAATFANPSKYNAGGTGLIGPFKGKNGTKVYARGFWDKRGRTNIVVAVGKYGFSEYSSRGKKDLAGMSAKWSKLGSLKFKFKPEQQQPVKFNITHPRCKKGMTVNGIAQIGRVKGKVKLKGEGNFVKVNRSVNGSWGYREMLNVPKCVFRTPKPEDVKGKSGVFFGVGDYKLGAWLKTTRTAQQRSVTMNAVTTKKYGKTWIYRESSQLVKVKVEPGDLAWAEIKAGNGKGISGDGLFERGIGEDPDSWTGNLKAHFIGKSSSLMGSKLKLEFVDVAAATLAAHKAGYPVAAGLPTPASSTELANPLDNLTYWN